MKKLQFYRDKELGCFEIKEGCSNLPAEKPHCHTEAAIGIIDKGRSVVSCQGQEFFVDEQHVVLFPPQVLHKCCPEDMEEWEFRMLYVQQDWVQRVFGRDLEMGVSVKQIPLLAAQGLKEGFAFLMSEADAPSKETALILMLSRVFALTDIAVYEGDDISSEAAEVVKAYLEDHYWETISLETMAAQAKLSKFHLIRVFDRCYGMPPHAYVMQLRMSQAKEMLRDDMDILDIALSLGFYDQSHFANTFKQYVGVTPRAYREME